MAISSGLFIYGPSRIQTCSPFLLHLLHLLHSISVHFSNLLNEVIILKVTSLKLMCDCCEYFGNVIKTLNCIFCCVITASFRKFWHDFLHIILLASTILSRSVFKSSSRNYEFCTFEKYWMCQLNWQFFLFNLALTPCKKYTKPYMGM